MVDSQTGEIGPGAPTERYGAIILGAGVSGLVAASVLLNQQYRRILVANTYSRLGGNHIDWSKGDYTFDVGRMARQMLASYFTVEIIGDHVDFLTQVAELEN